MNQLYTLGYQDGNITPRMLDAWLKMNDTLLVDIRWKPYAKNQAWTQQYLHKHFGTRYLWLGSDLGNTNYMKTRGDAIYIHDLDAGIKDLIHILEDKPCVIMCACWEFQTCHRKTISHHLAAKHDIEAIHLTGKDIKSLGVTQYKLF